ncbi:amino acid adenylation domain-containing protein, partial [Micromonospora sp. LOL_014]|uniref:amino acid adenylation domain-containing protein n=1 Tax=Micromonospora sp. LOL_014 TaxID=3345415 RepID=UPI003A89DD84
ADLAAYLVAAGPAPSPDELRAWLGGRLPDYMVPRYLVPMDVLPLTPQGKVDRRALPKPAVARPALRQRYEAPIGEVEELLSRIWGRVLGLDRVGRHDNFFDLGGDSIRSIQVLGRVRDAGLALGLQDLLDAPTPAGLAAHVAPAGPVPAPESRPFELVAAADRAVLPAGLADAYPMTQLQVGMVYEMERDPARNAYHNVETLRLAGRFDEARFRAATGLVVARHPVLRTSFDLTGFGEPMQLVHTAVEVPFLVVDLRRMPTAEQAEALDCYLREQQRARFDLATAPLCRMAVHVLADDAFQWTITEHHAILDGWSMVATIEEITGLYRRLLAGERPGVAPLRSLYRDFVATERAALRSARSRDFWRERLAATPDGRLPRWPAATVEPAAETIPGERHRRDEAAGHGSLATPLPADLLPDLTAFASRAGVPLKTVVLAAHLTVIGLLTGASDVLIGLTANGRLEETDGTEARGLFLNTVPLRVRLPDGGWHELAAAVFRAERDLVPHRRYPMAAVQRDFGGDQPLVETNFTYNNFHRIARLATDGTLATTGTAPALPGVARTNFPLDVTVSHEPGGGLLLEIDYTLQEFAAGQITRIRDYHLRALRAIAGDGAGEAHRRNHSLLGAAEERLLASWQGTGATVSEAEISVTPVHELLRERAARWPDAVAVESAAGTLTHAGLDARSEVLACRLAVSGVRRGDVVGLHLRPGVEAVVAVWAVWKAGGAFLPLDPELPVERLAAMLADARPAVVVSADADVDRVSGSWPVVSPDAGAGVEGVVLPRVGVRDLAYVMFTSGSSGRAKGVLVEHGSLANFAESLLLPRMRRAGVEPGRPARVVTGTSAFISDFFLAQLLPLLDGHRLLVLTGAEGRDPRRLVELARDPERAVQVIDATTSQVQLMVEAGLLDAPYPPRLISVGGEACPPDLWRALGSRPGLTAHNTYGPAEATVDAVYADVGAYPSPVLGRPYGNVRVYLVDDGLALVPPGVVGEIVLGGPGVGRGYLGRPGATAAVFVPDPWGASGGRLYRTGDLGRYTVDGQIEFLGRGDHQVKILGQRVEPEEVEAVLREHPDVTAAAVGAQRFGAEGGSRLVAYVVGDVVGDAGPDDLRVYLAARLPAAAVPSVFVPVDALPTTAGGKLDRRALTVPDDFEPEPAGRDVVAPRTDTERRVAEVWRDLLGLALVGVHDDFFALGGHSLLAVRLVMRVGAELGAGLPLHEIFARPTVAAQAALIDEHTTGEAGPIPRTAPDGDTPASHAQERQWFLWRLDPGSATYHVPWGYEIFGDLDPAVLGAAVRALAERHEPLRTTLHLDAAGRVVQRVGAAGAAGLAVRDAAEADLPGLIERAVRRPFDLSVGPILRADVWRTAPDRHVLLFVAHHVAVDEWSVDVLDRELWALYRAGGDAAAAGLPPIEVSYADYAMWHRDLVARRADDDLDYWRRTLDGAAPAWPKPSVTRPATVTAGERTRTLPADLLAGLDRIRARAGATEFAAHLAVYLLLLARVSGERDLTVGVPVAGRSHPDLAPLVGFFVNTLALRVTVRPEDDFGAHLRRVRSAVLDAFAHQEAPFEHVVRAVAADRVDGGNPLFRTLFAFTPDAPAADRLAAAAPGLTMRDLRLGGGGKHFDVTLGAARTPDGLRLDLEFGTDVLAEADADELLAAYADLLRTLTGSPHAAVSDLLAASPRERERITAWTGAGAVEGPVTPVHELLRERAARWPDAVAVESAAGTLTHAGLDARSEVLACRLAVSGVRRGDVVGLHLRPGVEAVVAVWAVWKAGGAFLPLDPELPVERLAAMLADARPAVVVSADADVDRVSGSWPVVSPDAGAGVEGVVLPRVGVRDLAYVMFTSGSSGRAKGVLVEHGSLANFAESLLLPRMRRAGVEPGRPARVVTGTSAFISDFFLAQLLPLLDGHRLLVLTGAEGRDPRRLVELARDPERAVQVIDATTSQVQLMVEAGLLDAPYPPRLISVGGEACPPDLWRALGSRPGLTAHNTYGPAEATVDAVYADVGAYPSPVLGRPYGNVRVYLVDDGLALVPPGVVGEIVLGGPGVGRGYLGRPGATAAVFVPDPWGASGGRLYRTGDLGRYTVDGQIEFLGRGDHQVKILGQRVEPEEVEAVPDGAEPAERTVPATGTERRIAAVWRDLLGVVRVGVHDDFFALGGHSLLAVRLAMALGREFRIEIPLATLYTAPTVAEQAGRLDALLRREGGDGGNVIRLDGVPGGRPLVLVHPVGGTLFSYRDLLAETRADFETYGVQGRFGAGETGAADVAGLARRYAEELVPVLEDREPVVAGWSAGGVIAHELARALAEHGIRTHQLVLVDADPRIDPADYRGDIAVLDDLRHRVAAEGPGPLLRSAGAGRLLATLGVDPAAVADLDGPTAAGLVTFWRDVFAGLAAHRPAPFPGPAALILGRGPDRDPIATAWRDLTGSLTVTDVDGDHFELLHHPRVTAVADALRGFTAQTGD